MTRETRIFIESEDVLGVEFECLNCHVRVFYTVGAPKQLASTCPNCNQRYSDSSQFDSDVRQLFAVFGAMSRLVAASRAKMRIQVKEMTTEGES